MEAGQAPEAAARHPGRKAAATRPGAYATVRPAIIPVVSSPAVAARGPRLVLLLAFLVIHHVALGVHATAVFAGTEDQGGHDDPEGDQGAFFHSLAGPPDD